ncbi:MAG TPA: hypothetical protein VNN22_16905 [Verrucomicrobiae bacterium]|nr:hypothetical protein [Verrucomicrobiae bacterium]
MRVTSIKQAAIGFSLTVLVVGLMAGWRMYVKAASPAHIQEIAAELAAVGKLYSTIPIMPNRACDKLLFGQSTEQGVGIFLLDIVSGQKHLMHEQSRKKYDPARFRLLGWAPDDSFFAYQRYEPQDYLFSRIIICKGNSGEMLYSFPVHEMMAGFVWLSPHAFAYMRITDGKRDLVAVEEKAGGEWVPLKPFKNITQKPASALTATSTHSVVWQEGNTLQRLNFATGLTEQIFESTSTGLQGFSFSLDTGKFLLLCRDKTGYGLFGFQPDEKGVWGGVRAGLFTNICSIKSLPNSMEKVLWTDNEKGIAYVVQDLGQRTLYIKTNTFDTSISLLARGSVVSFAVSRNQIFVAGSLTNEPPGIWQYDLVSGSLNCIYSSQEQPFKYTKYIVPLCRTVTNTSGKEITYHLWEPAKTSSNKKSPLLIGRSLYSWEVYPQVAANGGAFFVNVDRPSYTSANLNPWDEDIMTVYAELVKDSGIDTNAVFLYGSSSETEGLVSLVAKKPNLWKGAILLNPTSLPDLSGPHLSKILIDGGIDDAGTVKSAIKYQQAAADSGVSVTLALHQDAGHVYWSSSTKREQAQQLAKFLFGY